MALNPRRECVYRYSPVSEPAEDGRRNIHEAGLTMKVLDIRTMSATMPDLNSAC